MVVFGSAVCRLIVRLVFSDEGHIQRKVGLKRHPRMTKDTREIGRFVGKTKNRTGNQPGLFFQKGVSYAPNCTLLNTVTVSPLETPFRNCPTFLEESFTNSWLRSVESL